MGFGPVDVVIIGFPDNRFNGDVAPAILELVESGVVRIIDLLFVVKDADGVVTTLEIADLDADLVPSFTELDIHVEGALDHEDADELSEDLPHNSSALIIAFENAWAARFVDAVRASNGVVIDQIRIPAHVVNHVTAS